jgi:TonB family protein
MRTISRRSAVLPAAAAALACAAPLAAQQDSTAPAAAGHAHRRHDYFEACRGQEQAMALLADRPQARRREHAMPEVVRMQIRVSAVQMGSTPGTVDNPGSSVAIAKDLVLRLQVDAQGRVQQVELIQASGDQWMDQHIVDEARDQRFDPATETAFPVPGCAIQKVMVRS